jgi:hypothetical protein
MLYELKLNNICNDDNNDYLKNNTIVKTNKDHIINRDFYDRLLSISNALKESNHNINILNPYHYLNRILKKPIYFFIFKEIFNKFSLKIDNCALFSNSINNIECITEIVKDIKVCTKNKLYSSTKSIIHNYDSFINREKHNYYSTIIVNYEDYNSFIKCVLSALVIQKQNGTLILNVPSVTTNIIISLTHFIMRFYSVTIIKPFATHIYSTERYIICEKYKNVDNKEFFIFVKNCLNKINEHNYDEFIINNSKIEYFYLKQIIHDNSIWGTYVLNILNKFLMDDHLEVSHKENYNTVTKWLELLT